MREPVFLRPLERTDTEDIVRWRNSEQVKKNLFTQTDLTPAQHLHYYETVVCSGKCRQYIIVTADDARKAIGTVFLKNIDPAGKTAEFGIFIGEAAYRGKGLSASATRQILKVAFLELLLEEVTLSVVEDNLPARKSYERVGFQETGRIFGGFHRQAEILDVIEMKLQRDRWALLNYEQDRDQAEGMSRVSE